MTGETATFTARIVFSTEEGELPPDDQIRRLITDQLAGILDDYTGLQCLAVMLDRRPA